jgi:hypothetical protein
LKTGKNGGHRNSRQHTLTRKTAVLLKLFADDGRLTIEYNMKRDTAEDIR